MIDGYSQEKMRKKAQRYKEKLFEKLLEADGALLTLSDVVKKSLGIVGMK